MTFEVLKRISATDNLSDALRVVSENPNTRQGAIKIAGGAVKGVVAFVNGRITGAEVTGSSERGQRALTRLLALDNVVCKFAEFDDLLLANEYEISVDIHQLVIASDSQTVTQGMKVQSPAQVEEVRAAAVAHSELKEKETSVSVEAPDSKVRSDAGSIAVEEKPQQMPGEHVEGAPRVPLAESIDMDSDYSSVTVDIPMSQGQRSELADLYESAMAEEADRSAEVVAQANLMDSMQKAAGVVSHSTNEQSSAVVSEPAATTGDTREIALGDDLQLSPVLTQDLTQSPFDAAGDQITLAAAIPVFADGDQRTPAAAIPVFADGDQSTPAAVVPAFADGDQSTPAAAVHAFAEGDQITPAVAMPVFTMDGAEENLDFGLDATPPAVPVETSGSFDASVPEGGITGGASSGIGEPPPDLTPEHAAAKEAYGDMVQDPRFDNMIKEWEREEEKADFLSSDPSLTGVDESALSPDQKVLLEEMRKIHDPELFNESDPTLQVETEAELAMTDAQVELLLRAKLDDAPFQVEGIDPDLAMGESTELPQSKRNELEFFTQANKEEFDTVDGRIAQDGTVISEEERFLIEHHPSVPDEKAREEFLKADPALKDLDKPILREFTPLAPEEAAALAELPDAPPQTIADDFSPLVAMPEGEKDKKPVGLIGRVRGLVTGKIASYDGEIIREQFAPEKLIGPALLVVICVAMFTVPGWLKSSATGVSSDELARQQMRLAIEDEISDQTKYVTREPSKGAVASGGTPGPFAGSGGGGDGGTSASSDAMSTSDLGRAERLTAEGKYAQAAGLYESYLGSLGQSVKFRMKLIRLYMEAKEWEKAKGMCISALKLNPSEAERDEIWKLYRSLI